MYDFQVPPGTPVLIELQVFPCIEYLAVLARSGSVMVEAHENYQKGSYRNRYYIASVQGPLRLSVPLEKGKHQQLPIREVRMDDKQNWRLQHWRSIRTAYGKSPYFDHYSEELETILCTSEPFLFNWSLNILKALLNWLDMDLIVRLSDRYDKRPADASTKDLRNKIHPSNVALSGVHEKIYYYEQVFSSTQGFQKNLSILDMIFCLGPEAGFRIKKGLSA
jgi:hypothetical protein